MFCWSPIIHYLRNNLRQGRCRVGRDFRSGRDIPGRSFAGAKDNNKKCDCESRESETYRVLKSLVLQCCRAVIKLERRFRACRTPPPSPMGLAGPFREASEATRYLTDDKQLLNERVTGESTVDMMVKQYRLGLYDLL